MNRTFRQVGPELGKRYAVTEYKSGRELGRRLPAKPV